MAERSLRGMRLGSQSLQTEEGVVYAERANYTYSCSNCGRETVMVFSTEAEIPEKWQCRYCDSEAILLVNSTPVATDDSDDKTPRSHWDMLLERRSIPELEELLEERLRYLRARRGESKTA